MTTTALPAAPGTRPGKAPRPAVGIGDRLRHWWNSLSRPAQWAVGIPFIVIVALVPLVRPGFIDTAPATDLGGVFAQFGMYALIAIGLNVVVGSAGLLDLGYVGFYAVGAYTVALFSSPDSPWNITGAGKMLGQSWAWLALLPVAILVTAVSGLILGSPTLRLRGDYLAIVTLGFGEIVRLLADNLQNLTHGGQGLQGVAFPQIGISSTRQAGVFSQGNVGSNLNAGVWWFWLAMLLVVVVLLFVGNLERSRVGRAWVAIREDEDAAEIMGVPTFKFKLWAFVIGASIGGMSGALYAGQVQFVVPTNFNVVNSVLFLCAVVLGGQGNKLGVILGAFIIVYLPNRVMGIQVAGQSLGDYKYLFFGLALMVLMIFRPQGLIPVRQKLLAMATQVYRASTGKAYEETAPVAVVELESVSRASWGKRAAAILIDVAIAAAFFLAIFFLAKWAGDQANGQPGLMGLLVVLLYMVGYPAWLVFVLWNFLARQGSTGRSIGKSVVGISAVSAVTGQTLGGTDIFLRELLHLLDLVSVVGFLWPLWDPQRQTFADKIAGTMVITGAPVTAGEPAARGRAATVAAPDPVASPGAADQDAATAGGAA
jgi:branched-chain amino acid transport system permease protein